MREFPVDLVRLQEKFCASRHPRVIHGAPSVDRIFQELYAVQHAVGAVGFVEADCKVQIEQALSALKMKAS